MHRQSRFSDLLRRYAMAVVLAAVPFASSHAAQLIVTAFGDEVRGGDGCSIREALINANTDSKAGSIECQKGSDLEEDVIVLPPANIIIQSPLLVSTDMTILGGISWTVLDGRLTTRLLDVAPGVRLQARGLTLQQGSAAQGGALRVGAGAELVAEYLVVTGSRATAAGAGIYLATDAEATITRSEISYNKALDAGGRGAGVYCAADCRLSITQSTVTGNQADAGGAALVVEGQVELNNVTLSNNVSRVGAAVDVSGSLDLFASILADNGDLRVDVDCAADAQLSGETSYLETPGVDCVLPAVTPVTPGVPPPGIFTRAALPAAVAISDALTTASGHGYRGAPGRTHRIRYDYGQYLARMIPWADSRCRDGLDQYGHRQAPGVDCDLGALQAAHVSVWDMGVSLDSDAAGLTIPFYLHETSFLAPTRVRIRDVQGVGEDCSNIDTTVVVPAGESVGQFFVGPQQFFALPALYRSDRVCEFAIEVVSSDHVSDPAGPLPGAGNLRVRVQGPPVSTSGFSTPPLGSIIDFGSVPVGAGGVRTLLLTPSVAGFNFTGVEFRGADKERFELVSPSAVESAPGSGIYELTPEVPAADAAAGGTLFTLRCKPGVLGNFDAEMVVTTDNATYAELSYGVRCSPVHILSVTMLTPRVLEKDGPDIRFALTLDSPCLLDSDGLGGDDNDGVCFVANISDVASTATPGVDYEVFPTTVTFLANETQHIVTSRVIDDAAVEAPVEFVTVEVDVPASPLLRMAGVSVIQAQIDEDDEPVREIATFVDGIPANAQPGQTIPFTVRVHNRSNMAMDSVRVDIRVEEPMWVRGFALLGANCRISANRRSASCEIPVYLLPNQKPLADALGNPVSVADDESNTTRQNDGDWVTVYGRLLTAEMNRTPMFDVEGDIQVTARTGEPEAAAMLTRRLTVVAPASGESGGGVVGYPLLWMLLLLPWRRQLSRAAGRKTG